MVAIVPNRAEAEGKIVSLKKAKGRKEFQSMQLDLTAVSLLKEDWTLPDLEPGRTITILISRELVKINKLKTGLVISCMIRKAAGEDYFIIPDSLHIISEGPPSY
jgi:hypothetical protein